jgi:hypothetical protein
VPFFISLLDLTQLFLPGCSVATQSRVALKLRTSVGEGAREVALGLRKGGGGNRSYLPKVRGEGQAQFALPRVKTSVNRELPAQLLTLPGCRKRAGGLVRTGTGRSRFGGKNRGCRSNSSLDCSPF